MKNTESPIEDSDDGVEEREDDDECLVCVFCSFLLVLFCTFCKPDVGQENCIGKDGSDNEDILDDDPSSESCDALSNRRAGGDGWHQEGGQGQEESHQEWHTARDNLTQAQ